MVILGIRKSAPAHCHKTTRFPHQYPFKANLHQKCHDLWNTCGHCGTSETSRAVATVAAALAAVFQGIKKSGILRCLPQLVHEVQRG